jgi:uncharacterized protein YigA (DUF484 family)
VRAGLKETGAVQIQRGAAVSMADNRMELARLRAENKKLRGEILDLMVWAKATYFKEY